MFLLFTIVIGLAVAAFLFFLLDSALGKYDMGSSREAANQVVKIVKDTGLRGGVFYDLGSCRGGFALKIAKELPTMKIFGIDDSRFRTFLAKSSGVFLKNVVFKKENIFKANVSSADIVYVYLPKELMPELRAKLQKELKPGAVVITNRIVLPDIKPVQKIGELSVYKFA